MTCKEFKSAIEETLNMHFENWGWEGIMLELIMAHRAKAQEAYDFGYAEMAQTQIKLANKAHDYLTDRGYFDD